MRLVPNETQEKLEAQQKLEAQHIFRRFQCFDICRVILSVSVFFSIFYFFRISETIFGRWNWLIWENMENMESIVRLDSLQAMKHRVMACCNHVGCRLGVFSFVALKALFRNYSETGHGSYFSVPNPSTLPVISVPRFCCKLHQERFAQEHQPQLSRVAGEILNTDRRIDAKNRHSLAYQVG